MNIQIRRARPDEAELLTELAHAAKRHWGYPDRWIVQWKADLTITPDFVAHNEVYVAISNERIIGCSALVRDRDAIELEHMWIDPRFMGQGLGRALFQHACRRGLTLNYKTIELSADPNAAGFYRRMGAIQIGEVTSEIEGQARVLPRMVVVLDQAANID